MKRPSTIRLIIDTRDASLDRWITQEELDKLKAAGKVEQINCYANRWDWAMKDVRS